MNRRTVLGGLTTTISLISGEVDIQEEMSLATEVLFHPELVGLECDSLAESLGKAVMKSDINYRHWFWFKMQVGFS